MSVAEEHMDILQSIEVGIVKVSQEKEELMDYDVQDALEALLQVYKDQRGGSQSTRRLKLHEKAKAVYDAVKEIVELRLGRKGAEEAGAMEFVSLEVIIQCLQKIRNSVRRWNKEGGSKGYLSFVKKFVKV